MDFYDETDYQAVELDQDWTNLRKLRWKAARVSQEVGLPLTVQFCSMTDAGTELFSINYSGPVETADGIPTSKGYVSMPHTFTATWSMLGGIQLGADLARFAQPA